jgi:hypothetical protein
MPGTGLERLPPPRRPAQETRLLPPLRIGARLARRRLQHTFPQFGQRWIRERER